MSDFKPGDYVRCVNPLAADWFPLAEGAIYLVCSSSIQDEKLRGSPYFNPPGSIRLRAYPASCSASCFEAFDYRVGDWRIRSDGKIFWLKEMCCGRSAIKDPIYWFCIDEDGEEFGTNVSESYPCFGRMPHIVGEDRAARRLRLGRYGEDIVKRYDLKNTRGGW